MFSVSNQVVLQCDYCYAISEPYPQRYTHKEVRRKLKSKGWNNRQARSFERTNLNKRVIDACPDCSIKGMDALA